jgi:adenine-specific DNA-methyltransferase
MELINSVHPELNLRLENVHEHIIKYNIFGADMDEAGAKFSIITLMLKKRGSIIKPNIVCCDSLIDWENTYHENSEFQDGKFDIIVGNPPYIGHKRTSSGYRKLLNSIYGDVFKDKADISFCFIKSSIDRLAQDGRLCFITSRYFIESPSGRNLRNFIRQNCTIERIVDFYGVRIMKGISVDPVIVYLKRNHPPQQGGIDVVRAKQSLKTLDGNSVFEKVSCRDSSFVKSFYVSQQVLDDQGWILCSNEEVSVIRKIEQRLNVRLSDVCTSFQGIITGCDRAFVINEALAEKYGIEKDIIRRLIKNSNIKKIYCREQQPLYNIF